MLADVFVRSTLQRRYIMPANTPKNPGKTDQKDQDGNKKQNPLKPDDRSKDQENQKTR
jgi:hypothetical protein